MFAYIAQWQKEIAKKKRAIELWNIKAEITINRTRDNEEEFLLRVSLQTVLN